MYSISYALYGIIAVMSVLIFGTIISILTGKYGPHNNVKAKNKT